MNNFLRIVILFSTIFPSLGLLQTKAQNIAIPNLKEGDTLTTYTGKYIVPNLEIAQNIQAILEKGFMPKDSLLSKPEETLYILLNEAYLIDNNVFKDISKFKNTVYTVIDEVDSIRSIAATLYPIARSGWISFKDLPKETKIQDALAKENHIFSSIELLGRAWVRLQMQDTTGKLNKNDFAKQDSAWIIINNFKTVRNYIESLEASLQLKKRIALTNSQKLSTEHSALLKIAHRLLTHPLDAEPSVILDDCLEFAKRYEDVIGIRLDSLFSGNKVSNSNLKLPPKVIGQKLKPYWQEFNRSQGQYFKNLNKAELFEQFLQHLKDRQYQYRKLFSEFAIYSGSHKQITINLSKDYLNTYLESLYKQLETKHGIEKISVREVYLKLIDSAKADSLKIVYLNNTLNTIDPSSLVIKLLRQNLNVDSTFRLTKDNLVKVKETINKAQIVFSAYKAIVDGILIPVFNNSSQNYVDTLFFQIVPRSITYKNSDLTINFQLNEYLKYVLKDSITTNIIQFTGITYNNYTSKDLEGLIKLNKKEFEKSIKNLGSSIADKHRQAFKVWLSKKWNVPEYWLEKIETFDYEQGLPFNYLNKCFRIVWLPANASTCTIIPVKELYHDRYKLNSYLENEAKNYLKSRKKEITEKIVSELDKKFGIKQLQGDIENLLNENNIHLKNDSILFEFPLDNITPSLYGLNLEGSYNLKDNNFTVNVSGAPQYIIDSYLQNFTGLIIKNKKITDNRVTFEIHLNAGALQGLLGSGLLTKDTLLIESLPGKINVGAEIQLSFTKFIIDRKNQSITLGNIQLKIASDNIFTPADGIMLVYLKEKSGWKFDIRGDNIANKLDSYLQKAGVTIPGINVKTITLNQLGFKLTYDIDAGELGKYLGINLDNQRLEQVKTLVKNNITDWSNGLPKISWAKLFNNATDAAKEEFLVYINRYLNTAYTGIEENLNTIIDQLENKIKSTPGLTITKWKKKNGQEWQKKSGLTNGLPYTAIIRYNPFGDLIIDNVSFSVTNSVLDFSQTTINSTVLKNALRKQFAAINITDASYKDGVVVFKFSLLENGLILENAKLNLRDKKLNLDEVQLTGNKLQTALDKAIPFLSIREASISRGILNAKGDLNLPVGERPYIPIRFIIDLRSLSLSSNFNQQLLTSIANNIIEQTIPQEITTENFKLNLDNGKIIDSKYLILSGSANYSDEFSISCIITIEINLIDGEIKFKPKADAKQLLEPIKKGLIAGLNELLASAEMNWITIVDAVWEPNKPNTIPQGILFKSEVKLPKPFEDFRVSIPDVRVNRKGVEFVGFSRLSITVPLEIPIPPAFRLASASATIEDNLISVGAMFTLAPPKSEYLVNLRGTHTIDLKRIGYLKTRSDLNVLTLLNMGHREQEIDVRQASFTTEMNFGKFLSKMVNIEGELAIYGKEMRINGEGNIKFFDQDALKGNIDIDLNNKSINAKAKADLIVTSVNGSIHSNSGFSNMSFTGSRSFGIGKFNLSGANFTVNEYTTQLGFTVLGVKGNFVTPGYKISSSELLEYIIKLLTPDFRNLDEAIKGLLRGEFEINPLSSFGSGDGGGKGKGDGGSGGVQGAGGDGNNSGNNGNCSNGCSGGFGGLDGALQEKYGDKPIPISNRPIPQVKLVTDKPIKDTGNGGISITGKGVDKRDFRPLIDHYKLFQNVFDEGDTFKDETLNNVFVEVVLKLWYLTDEFKDSGKVPVENLRIIPIYTKPFINQPFAVMLQYPKDKYYTIYAGDPISKKYTSYPFTYDIDYDQNDQNHKARVVAFIKEKLNKYDK